jgi:hypothetical protein
LGLKRILHAPSVAPLSFFLKIYLEDFNSKNGGGGVLRVSMFTCMTMLVKKYYLYSFECLPFSLCCEPTLLVILSMFLENVP